MKNPSDDNAFTRAHKPEVNASRVGEPKLDGSILQKESCVPRRPSLLRKLVKRNTNQRTCIPFNVYRPSSTRNRRTNLSVQEIMHLCSLSQQSDAFYSYPCIYKSFHSSIVHHVDQEGHQSYEVRSLVPIHPTSSSIKQRERTTHSDRRRRM